MRANKKSRTLPEKLDRRLQTSSISIGKSKTSASASFHHRPRRRDSIPPSPQRHTTPLRQSPRFAMAAVADRSHLSAMDANTVDANAATEAPCKQPASHPSTKAPEAFVFACPGCGATLQAALQAEITSVQCDSCRDVFDVQMPPRDAPPIAPPPRAPPPAATGGAGAFTLSGSPRQSEPRTPCAAAVGGPAVGQQRNRPEQLDSTATELESSLMTCAHHREQIEQAQQAAQRGPHLALLAAPGSPRPGGEPLTHPAAAPDACRRPAQHRPPRREGPAHDGHAAAR